MRVPSVRPGLSLVAALAFIALLSSCSINQLAVRTVVRTLDWRTSIGFWESDYDDDLVLDNNTAEENDYETCVDIGLRAYCNLIEMPEVIDPSDAISYRSASADAGH